ncbi:centrosomal protein 43-like isoform X1 [Haemaphysalis longicornis]
MCTICLKMAADEDIELRDLLLGALEKRGVINRIKAELRASVYLALEEQLPSPSGARELGGEEQGRLLLAASLVHDFLHASGLRFTLSVLEPEVQPLLATVEQLLSRQELSGQLCLEAERPGPLLLQLLQRPSSPRQQVAASQADREADDGADKESPPCHQEVPPPAGSSSPAVAAASGRLPPLLPADPPAPPVAVEGEPHSGPSTASRRTEPSGSEESVQEELSHLDDSSLSTSADDRTGDQSVSRSSELDGCDYAEPAAAPP